MTVPAVRPLLSAGDAHRIEARVAEVETATGVQVVCAIHARADSYPEAPWRAFALAAVMAAGCVLIADAALPRWRTGATTWMDLATVLAVGLVAAALTLWSPPIARLFVTRSRRDVEVGARAKALFVEHALDAARPGAVLLFASRFEARAAVVPSALLRDAIAWPSVVHAIQGALRGRSDVEALLIGLDVLAAALHAAGVVPGAGERTEVANDVLQAGAA